MSAQTPTVTTICAVEERMDGRGGAIATWVREVFSRLETSTVIVCPMSTREFTGPLTTNPGGSSVADGAVRVIRGFAQITRRNPTAAVIVLSQHGRLWVRAARKQILRSSIVHLQNRADYAPWLRQMGFDGTIICHMHNDMTSRNPSAAAINAVDHWIFCSDFIKERAIALYGVDASRTTTIYNGTVSNSTPRHSRDKNGLLFVGRIEEQKGPREALDIWAGVVRSGIDIDLTLVGPNGIGGNGPSHAYAQSVLELMETYNREFSGRAHARYAGSLPHADVLNEMNSAKVLLMPCSGLEAFGMVLVEAMAQATPVVATDLGGIPEIVTPQSGALIGKDEARVPDGVKAVCAILNLPPAEYASLSEGAYLRSRHFDWETPSRQLEALYQELQTSA